MINLSTFKGEIPKLSDKRLPAENAADAKNCSLESGNLQPINGVSSVEAGIGATAQTIYKMGTKFLRWTSAVSVAKALVADSGDRILFTGDGYPKETNSTLALTSAPYPTATRRLGIPAPTNALTVTLNGTAGEDIVHSSSYVYTIVAKWADGSEVESGPSSPTAVIDVYSGITPRLTGFTDATATGVYTTHFRIYRLNSGNVGAEYQYVDEMVVATTQYDDTIADDDLGEVMPSTLWDAPDSALAGLIATSHGIMAGFKGNTIYPSEVFTSYAYPSSYSLPVESDIIGLGYTGSLIIVLTETVPYLLLGQDPATMSLKRLGYQQPCISAKSIVNVPGGVVYTSPDGLVKIDEAGLAPLITKHIFTKAQWKALTPANLMGVYYDDAYFGFFSGTTTGFRLDLETGDYQPIELTAAVYGVEYCPEDDLLYLIQTNGATRDIVSWDSGSAVDYAWTSKIFSYSDQIIPMAGFVQGVFTAGNTTITVYVDGVSVTSKTISASGVFRIPPKRGNDIQIKLVGKATIDRVRIGRSVREVTNG